jgi:hypothetical protein
MNSFQKVVSCRNIKTCGQKLRYLVNNPQVKKVAIVIGIAWSGTNCVIIFCKGIASKRLWCKILYFILSALNGVSCFDNSRSLLSNFYWRIPFSFILSSRSLALILYLVEILLLIQ